MPEQLRDLGEAATFIPHSHKAFIHNEWTEPPHGLTLNPEPFLYAIMKKRKGAFP